MNHRRGQEDRIGGVAGRRSFLLEGKNAESPISLLVFPERKKIRVGVGVFPKT